MKKIYNYGKCVVELVIPNTSSDNIRKATEAFLRKVTKEIDRNGNSD